MNFKQDLDAAQINKIILEASYCKELNVFIGNCNIIPFVVYVASDHKGALLGIYKLIFDERFDNSYYYKGKFYKPGVIS